MRISDWSSDGCSSDRLRHRAGRRRGVETRGSEFLGMVVVVLADAEDVAAWQRDRCLQLDIGKRDRLAQFRQRLPLGRQAGQSVHAALGLATLQREGPDLARGLVKDADAPFAIDAECTYLHFFLRLLALISTVSSGCRGSAAGWAGQRAVEIAQAPVLQAVNQAVHLELLPAAPGIEHDRRLGDAAHLGDDVQLAEPVEALLVVGQALELGRAALRGVADRLQPVVDDAVALAVYRRLDAAAAVVAGHDDLAHLELLHRELPHREAVERTEEHTSELQQQMRHSTAVISSN